MTPTPEPRLSTYAPGPPVTGPVYHYTSATGLHGMITSGTLRASEASSLNDLAEARQGWEAIRRVLPTFPESDTRDLLLSHAQNPLNGSHEVFVLCASTQGDDANQWRLYADGAHGYVMELDGSVQLTATSDYPPRERPETEPGKVAFDWSFIAEVALVTPWLQEEPPAPQKLSVQVMLIGAQPSPDRPRPPGIEKSSPERPNATGPLPLAGVLDAIDPVPQPIRGAVALKVQQFVCASSRPASR